MEGELPESSNRKLNRAIATTVVILSVATALSKIKDDNIVQAMQADQSAKVDYWSEYQADRIKLRIAQSAPAGVPVPQQHYDAESKAVKAEALAAEADYVTQGRRDDQFDLADGFASIALAVTAISALIESWWLLGVGWASGGFALLFMVAGFAQLPIHPDWLVSFLT